MLQLRGTLVVDRRFLLSRYTVLVAALFLVFVFAGCGKTKQGQAKHDNKQKTVQTLESGSTTVTKVKVGNKVMTIEEEEEEDVETGPTAKVP
jgi:predicted membrane protein